MVLADTHNVLKSNERKKKQNHTSKKNKMQVWQIKAISRFLWGKLQFCHSNSTDLSWIKRNHVSNGIMLHWFLKEPVLKYIVNCEAGKLSLKITLSVITLCIRKDRGKNKYWAKSVPCNWTGLLFIPYILKNGTKMCHVWVQIGFWFTH